MSPYKISIRGLLARLYKSFVGKISVRGLLARSLNKISIRATGPIQGGVPCSAKLLYN